MIRSGRPRVDLEVGFHGSRSLQNPQSQMSNYVLNKQALRNSPASKRWSPTYPPPRQGSGRPETV